MTSLLTYGSILMVAGMGMVIIFLSLMVLVMQVSGAFFRKYGTRFQDVSDKTSRSGRIAADADAIAAVMAAITAYQKR